MINLNDIEQWLDRMLMADNPTIIGDWILPLIIGLVALGLPLLIDNILRVEKKYKRNHVGSMIKSSWHISLYKCALVLTLFFVGVYFVQLERIGDWGGLNYFIDHSASILLILFATILLVSVLLAAYYIVEHTIDTDSLYKYHSSSLQKYFIKIAQFYRKFPKQNYGGYDSVELIKPSKDASCKEWLRYCIKSKFAKKYDPKNEEKLEKTYNFRPLFAIIGSAIQENDWHLFKTISKDLQSNIKAYRETYASNQTENRHILVEYPSSLLNEVYELACVSFEKNDSSIQKQVHRIIDTIFLDIPNANNWDIPKYGLSRSSLQLLWEILLEAARKKSYTFMTLYWASIYEYTKRMFHAPVVSNMRGFLPSEYELYQLNDEDKMESSLIAYLHLMWLAFLYEEKEYKILQEILEYQNGYVQELAYLEMNTLIVTYSYLPISQNKLAGIWNIMDLNRLFSQFSYYSLSSYSNLEKQKIVVANFVSALVHLKYNYSGDVPMCSPNIVKLSDPMSTYLHYALKNQQEIPSFKVNNISIKNTINEDGLVLFFSALKEMNPNEKSAFIAKSPTQSTHINELFSSIRRELSFELYRREFLWLNDSKVEHNTSCGVEEIESSVLLMKDSLITEEHVERIWKKASDIAKSLLKNIEEKVILTFYLKNVKENKDVKNGNELKKTIKSKKSNDRCILYYDDEQVLNRYAEVLDMILEPQRGYLSSKERMSPTAIKCVKLSNGDNEKLKNQIVIIDRDQQPVVQFIQPDIAEGYESIHEYTKRPAVLEDRMESEYRKKPLFTKFIDEIDEQGNPQIQVVIKGKVEIFKGKDVKMRQIILDEYNIKKATTPQRRSAKGKTATKNINNNI